MKDIILLTTGDNEVRRSIEASFTDPAIIDCSAGRKDVLSELEKILNEGAGILLTYRCPFLIPENLYSKASGGGYNIHPSLLPAYAGLNPWTEIFKDKVRHTGVTLHRLDPLPDNGEILMTAAFEIEENDTIETARRKADKAAADLLKFFLEKM